ncbi:MAG: HAMP domain-containing histidine kinase, partial [Lachnospiraceae bacterium]|nr:HAMP domain-containing histidine kinase [Lachnospiraceae bacterium]
ELYLREKDEKQKKYYEKVIRDRMEDLTLLFEELFTYTKLQNASYELVLEETNFSQIVMNCLFDFYEQWQESHITPKLEIDEIPAPVLCNESAVKRILTNILRNATIHGKSNIQINYQIQNGQVLFRCSNPVADTEDPDPEQVFDRFYRADTARSQTSNGLGLSIAMELTKRMDGEIQAVMEDDIFTIEVRFPLLH